mgnify:CR=1 FL=1
MVSNKNVNKIEINVQFGEPKFFTDLPKSQQCIDSETYFGYEHMRHPNSIDLQMNSDKFEMKTLWGDEKIVYECFQLGCLEGRNVVVSYDTNTNQLLNVEGVS